MNNRNYDKQIFATACTAAKYLMEGNPTPADAEGVQVMLRLPVDCCEAGKACWLNCTSSSYRQLYRFSFSYV